MVSEFLAQNHQQPNAMIMVEESVSDASRCSRKDEIILHKYNSTLSVYQSINTSQMDEKQLAPALIKSKPNNNIHKSLASYLNILPKNRMLNDS